jgi:hypothetical protein
MSLQPGSGERRISVDWDGTCVENKWPEMGDWLPGAREALRQLLDSGFEVVIFSTRLAPCDVDEETPRPAVQAGEIRHVRYMLNAAGLQDVDIWTKPWKVGARFYVDDKALEFSGDWKRVLVRIADSLEPEGAFKRPTMQDVDVKCNAFDVIQVDPENNPSYVMGPDDEVPRRATIDEAERLGISIEDYYGLHDVPAIEQGAKIRSFSTGATRNADTNKPDFDGFLSPLALEAFGAYMHEHRFQADGTLRDSDNWQKGIPVPAYRKSLFRHLFQAWRIGRGWPTPDYDDPEKPVTIEEALCGVLFNAMGWLHEIKKAELEQEEAA